MGREIRKVPPNWQHPRNKDGTFQPKHYENYDDAAKKWIQEMLLWHEGKHPCQLEYESAKEDTYYWEWDGPPPDKDFYIDYKLEDATWYQVYETVSEGTPVTPAFATQQELIDYLVEHGDRHQQQMHKKYGDKKPGYPREAAEKFVLHDGWCPSMTVMNGVLKEGIESVVDFNSTPEPNHG